MYLLKISGLTKAATSLALVIGTSTTFVAVSAEPAFAEGSGSSGRGRTRVLTSNADEVNQNAGGGATSRRDAKASHVAETIAAAPEVELNSYRDGQIALAAAMTEQSEALAEYTRLKDMTEATIATEFPDGGYEDSLAKATQTFIRTRDEITLAQAVVDQSLMQLTGGETLTSDQLASLHGILGL